MVKVVFAEVNKEKVIQLKPDVMLRRIVLIDLNSNIRAAFEAKDNLKYYCKICFSQKQKRYFRNDACFLSVEGVLANDIISFRRSIPPLILRFSFKVFFVQLIYLISFVMINFRFSNDICNDYLLGFLAGGVFFHLSV